MEAPLKLRSEMTGTWLIQRLQKPFQWKIGGKEIDNPFSFGGGLRNGGLSQEAMGLLRGIFSFDYMGSSEFEWGAVPNAIRFIAEQSGADGVVTGAVLCGGKSVMFVCPKTYENEVRKRIAALYDDEYKFRLKEHCGLKDALTSDKDYHKRNCGWIELDNGFMFFTDGEMFDAVCKLFGIAQHKED